MADWKQQIQRLKDQSWSTLWRTALVRLPRVVPMEALHFTNPEGPQPFVLHLPSRQRDRKIPLHIFLPPMNLLHSEVENNGTKFPVVMDYHGGGFYLGSYLEQSPFCSKLCRELQAVVITVDYRMAPLDKFPAAIEDAEDVTLAVLSPSSLGYHVLRSGIADYLRGQWHEAIKSEEESKNSTKSTPPSAAVQLDISRIAFSGASSGGNIALNMAISVAESMGLPDWPSPIPADYPTQIPLLLLYPSLDLRQLPSERFRHQHMPPVDEHKWLDIDDHLAATYVSRALAGHHRASPGLVDTSTGLHRKSKILLILSGVDTLWEQSKLWCEKLIREGRGGDVKVIRYEECKHGWTTIPEIALSAEEKRTRVEVLDECVRFTKVAWQGQDPVRAPDNELGDVVSP